MDTKTDRPRIRWGIIAGVTVALVVFVGSFMFRDFVRSGRSERNWLASELLQLDAAKEQWAIENKKEDGDIVTKEDLQEYLAPGFGMKAQGAFRYIINPIGMSPQAVVVRGISGYQEGTVVELDVHSNFVVKKPDF